MKLNVFGVDLESELVVITTDGCAMMKKLGWMIPPFQQFCYAHGLQLVIQDLFCTQSHNTLPFYYSSTSETDEKDDFEIMDGNDEID